MAQFLYALTSSNINRFSKLFTVEIRRKSVIILSLKIPPHLKCVATLLCEMSSDFKATIENKTTSVTSITNLGYFSIVCLYASMLLAVSLHCQIAMFITSASLHISFLGNATVALWLETYMALLQPVTNVSSGTFNLAQSNPVTTRCMLYAMIAAF